MNLGGVAGDEMGGELKGLGICFGVEVCLPTLVLSLWGMMGVYGGMKF